MNEEFEDLNLEDKGQEVKLEKPEIVVRIEQPAKGIKKRRENPKQFNLDQGKNPWERQLNERPQDYQKFLMYMNLGENRSHARVIRVINGDNLTAEEMNRKIVAMQQHAWKWRWSERIDAFEASVIARQLAVINSKTEKFPGQLISILSDSAEIIQAIQAEKSQDERKKIVAENAQMLAVAMGKRGPSFLLDGYKTIYGQKTRVDINERSVKLNFKFQKKHE